MEETLSKSPFKLRFGIVGSNFIVEKVIAGARFDPRFELTAIYSRTQERADEFAAKHNIPHTFTSLEEMAASPLIDAVYIASPNSLHASQSILCMKHGKHVLCEKPLASNAREVREMIRVAKENDVLLMEAMKPTLTPNFSAISGNLDKLGKIRRYFSCYCQYSSRYDSFRKGSVENAFKLELSNGAVMDIGVYPIYPMVVLFGRPKKIQAMGEKLSTGVDGQGVVNFEYDDMLATVLFSKIADSSLITEIQGEDGTLMVDKINIIKKVQLQKRGGELVDLTLPEAIHEYYYEVAEFISLVEQGKRDSTVNSLENSLITIEIVDEVRRQLGVVYPADK